MCGIAGFLAKRDGVDVAATLTAMLAGAARPRAGLDRACRSTARPSRGRPGGVGLGRRRRAARPRAGRCSDGVSDGRVRAAPTSSTTTATCGSGCTPEDGSPDGDFGRWPTRSSAAQPGVRVFSLGSSLELLKYTSDARRLCERWRWRDPFTHAIGHARMATESRVDVNHSHPFWARPFPDVTVVHNGHVTNYYKNRRIYEMRGYTFQTEQRHGVRRRLPRRADGERALARRGRAAARSTTSTARSPTSSRPPTGSASRATASRRSPASSPRPTTGSPSSSEGIALAGAFGDERRDSHLRAAPAARRGRGRASDGTAATRTGSHARGQRRDARAVASRAAPRPSRCCNPGSRHSLAVGILEPRRGLVFRGDVGYFCGGLSDGLDIEVDGDAGWSLGADMMSGKIVVHGNSGSLDRASIRGGLVVVKGDAGARSGDRRQGRHGR